MARPLLHLVLILRDEEKVVRKTLDSCKGVVDGLTVIVDEATTDKTVDVVEEWARQNDMRGVVIVDKFEDFASQRNKALDFDRERDDAPVFTLSMSADETLQNGDKLRSYLEPRRDDIDGAYLVTMQTDTRRWPYSRVLRTDGKWRYEGIIQEQPVSPDGQSRADKMIPGVLVLHAESDPKRKLKRLRECDLPLLTKFVEDDSKSLVDRARGMFFLAETHLFLAHNTDADANGDLPVGGAWHTHYFQALSLYWRHAQLSEREANLIDEREGKGKGVLARDSAMRAYFMFLYVADKIELYHPSELESRLEDFVKDAPNMAEAHYLLADCAGRVDPRRGLFFAMRAYEVAFNNEKKADQVRFAQQDTNVKWGALALAARCAHNLGDDRRATTLAKRAIDAGCPPTMFAFKEEKKGA